MRPLQTPAPRHSEVPIAAGAPRAARERWQDAGAGARYARARWRSAARAARDPRLVGRLLARHAAGAALVLDAPCGAGRLAPALRGAGAKLVGLDASRSMLEAAGGARYARRLCGDVFHLPLRDRAFDTVVCCRLLHHLDERAELARAVAELVRVAERCVIASYWDAATLEALQGRLGLRRADARRSRHRVELEELFAACGAPVVAHASTWPRLARQTFLVARRAPPAPSPAALQRTPNGTP